MIITKFAEFASEHPHISYQPETKAEFKKLGHQYLMALSVMMPELIKREVTFNPGGIAVSGDFHLRGMFNDKEGFDLFFNLGGGIGSWITYRSTTGMQDYTGGRNQQLPMSVFATPEKIVEALRALKKG